MLNSASITNSLKQESITVLNTVISPKHQPKYIQAQETHGGYRRKFFTHKFVLTKGKRTGYKTYRLNIRKT